MRLQGKVAVITGAGSGMGKATALLFAQEGARLALNEWNEARLNEVVAEIKAAGGEVVGARGDIADKVTAEQLIELAVGAYGRIDILVNNAGVMDYMQGVGEVTDDVWRRVLGINLDGPMFTSRRAIPHMVAQGSGSIINVASVASLGGGAAGAAYTASKHAVAGLTRNTAWVYAPKGIRCNAICPGGAKTNIADSMPMDRLDPAGAARAGAYAAIMPAMLESEDIASLALFLASDESRHINGVLIPADGGWTAA